MTWAMKTGVSVNRIIHAILAPIMILLLGALATVILPIGILGAGLSGKPWLKVDGKYLQVGYRKNMTSALIAAPLILILGLPTTAVVTFLSPFWILFSGSGTVKFLGKTYRF